MENVMEPIVMIGWIFAVAFFVAFYFCCLDLVRASRKIERANFEKTLSEKEYEKALEVAQQLSGENESLHKRNMALAAELNKYREEYAKFGF